MNGDLTGQNNSLASQVNRSKLMIFDDAKLNETICGLKVLLDTMEEILSESRLGSMLLLQSTWSFCFAKYHPRAFVVIWRNKTVILAKSFCPLSHLNVKSG